MTQRHRTSFVLFLVLVVAACASATKRLNQGVEAEADGDYAQAASRYIDALGKDRSLVDAREALFAVWDSVLAQGLRNSDRFSLQQDFLAAADEIRALDWMLANAGDVGAALPTDPDYVELRRLALDRAIQALVALADVQRGEARWDAARSSYRRIRADYDPQPEQRQASIEAEADVLLDWSRAEAMDGRFRASYLRAAEAMELSDQLPAALVDASMELQQQALTRGLKVLAVFPVETTAEMPTVVLPELAAQLTDVLDLEHWRRPPYFVAVADPAAVRQATRRLSPPGLPLRPGRVLAAVGADFGALLQVTSVGMVEEDVKSLVVDGRTRDQRRATYRVEEGRALYTATVRVTLFHGDGLVMQAFEVRDSQAGRFERGVYGGDPQNLDLTRGERRLFDVEDQRLQRSAAVEELIGKLAQNVSSGVFDRVLRRIP